MITYACMLAVKPCMLSDPDWKHIPWSNAPEKKSELQHLFDILVDVPEITTQFSHPLQSPTSLRPSATLDIDTIYTKATAMLRALDRWRRKWYALHYEDFFETQPKYVPKAWATRSEELSWKTCWYFSSLNIATAYTHYHETLVLVLRAIWNCETSGLLNVEHPNIDRRPQIYACCIEICRCVDYHLIESQKGAGSLFILSPVRIAWKSLGEESIESQWLAAAMADVSAGERGRWAIAIGSVSEFKPQTGSPLAPQIYDSTVPESPTEP